MKIERVDQGLSTQTAGAVQDARTPGASSWLDVLPLEENGFSLDKGEFRDAIQLRYAKDLKGLPSKSPFGQKFDVTHALNCTKGGFVIIRHNNIRNFEETPVSKILNDVKYEPQLQPVDGEIVNGLLVDNARPDIRASGFWRAGQNAFFDVRITNTNSPTQQNVPTEKVIEKHEKQKRSTINNEL